MNFCHTRQSCKTSYVRRETAAYEDRIKSPRAISQLSSYHRPENRELPLPSFRVIAACLGTLNPLSHKTFTAYVSTLSALDAREGKLTAVSFNL